MKVINLAWTSKWLTSFLTHNHYKETYKTKHSIKAFYLLYKQVDYVVIKKATLIALY
jgi:hypothetical protein